MRLVVAYYSRTGNTKALAMRICDEAWQRNLEVTTIRIRNKRRPTYFGCKALASGRRRPVVANVPDDLDLRRADVIVAGGPIWFDVVAPFVTEYLERAEGVRGKPAGVFVTCSYPAREAVDYAEGFAEEARHMGLDIRSALGASRKERLVHPSLVRAFMDRLLEGTAMNTSDEWRAVPPPRHR